ncbi:MAG: hypothetical protein JW936_01675 [Sedimentisphaerales bacterium]|nr:hypothetical protein [Sedimentisphaerales bacterium]
MCLFVCGCAAQPTEPGGREVLHTPDVAPASVAEAERQHDVVVTVANNLLTSLALREYRQLETFIDPEAPAIPGEQLAAQLLGPRHDTIVIEYWDIQQMQVSFNEDITHAFVETVLSYRPTPNRPAIDTPVQLHFCRSSASNPWYLCREN